MVFPPNTNQDSSLLRHAGILAALAAVAFLLVVPATAHAPQDIDVVYDPVTEKLYVTITHPVDDPAAHYINKVQVKHNGHVISDPDYKSQPTKDTFTYTYDLRASPPDIFWVLVTCSRGGTLEEKYEIPYTVAEARTAVPAAQAPVQAPQPAPTQKSPAGILPVLGAAAVLVWKKV